MFFLGGFNTVIPYLLYLCVIWAFMIIGLSGRLNTLWPHKICSEEEQIEIQYFNNYVYVNYDLSEDYNEFTDGERPRRLLVYSVQIKEKIPPSDDTSPFHKPLKSNLFRGPPMLS